jgi:hypothetical protein
VIGWSYGKTALYTAHALVRAVVVFIIWMWMPQERLWLLPLSVSVIYLLSVAAILFEATRLTRALETPRTENREPRTENRELSTANR